MNTANIVGKYLLATKSEKVNGANWYPEALEIATAIAHKTGVDVLTVAAVIAALSPNNKWERNCKDAEDLIAVYVVAGAEAAADVKVCTYGKNKAKAIVLLECGDPTQYEAILNGRKVVAFYQCIIGSTTAVVVDGHAYSVWVGERLTMKEVPSIGIKLYRAISDDYRAAAAHINATYGCEYTAAQIQAITWVAHKRIHGV